MTYSAIPWPKRMSDAHVLFRKHQEKRSTDATLTYATISPSDKVRCNPAISFLRKSSNWLTRFNKRCALRYISCSLLRSFSSVISFIVPPSAIHNQLASGSTQLMADIRKKRNFIWLNAHPLFFASSSIWRILNLLRSLRCTA